MSIQKDETEKNFKEEIEVTSCVSSSCLFDISKSHYLIHLKILESTEMTIHQNIERHLKNCESNKFYVGDKALVKDTDLHSGLRTGGRYDPLQLLYVIAEVVEFLPSSMYKLKLSNSEGFYQKSAFQEQMVLFKVNEDISLRVPDSLHGIGKRTEWAVLEAISDSKAPHSNMKTCFSKLFSSLDFGVVMQHGTAFFFPQWS